MDLLRAFHDFTFGTALAKLFPNPFTLVCLVLMVWSVAPALRGAVDRGFVWLTRLSWLVFALYGLSGVVLALSGPQGGERGGRSGQDRHQVRLPARPQAQPGTLDVQRLRAGQLVFHRSLIAGKLIDRRRGLYFLPVVTLFLWGCAYMIGRVAVFPGESN